MTLNLNTNLSFGTIISRTAMKQIHKSDNGLTKYSPELKKIKEFKKGDEDEPHIVYAFDKFQLGLPLLYKIEALGSKLPRLEDIKHILNIHKIKE